MISPPNSRFGLCCLINITKNLTIFIILVAAPASVIGIGGDHSNLSNDKDQYDHVMSPFHRKFILIDISANISLFSIF
jgi:hypothetical protein